MIRGQPQQDRSRVTRHRVVEATVESLSELGWTGTTVGVVAERAGVSRGATQHHFPTRELLFAAALDHMGEVRLAEIRWRVAQLPQGGNRTESVVRMLVGLYTGPLFRAALQVHAAASADAALREQVIPAEARFGREAHRVAVELLGVDESVAGVRELIQATLDLARGLGLAGVLTDDTKRRRRVIRQWAGTLDTALQAALLTETTVVNASTTSNR